MLSTVPTWKAALLERKRRQDKDSAPTAVGDGSAVLASSDTEQLDMTGVPSWKRDMLTKKKQQKNTFVFVARSTDGCRNDVTNKRQDCPTDFDSSASLTLTNGDAGSSHATNRHVGPNHFEENDDELVAADQSFSVDTSRVDHLEMAKAELVEDRLLPINQNPILLHDLEKRHSARNSLSPRSASGSLGGGTEKISAVEPVSPSFNLNPLSFNDTENEEVFSVPNGIEDEFTYGKGFVHKILMKFSHLSGSDISSVPHISPTRTKLGSQGETSRSPATSPRDKCRMQSNDAESGSAKRSNGISQVKFNSVDDLLNEGRYHTFEDDENSTSKNSNGDCDFAGSSPALKKSSKFDDNDDEELPLTNFVSNTRSLFESLSPKPPTTSLSWSNRKTTSNHFLYAGSAEHSGVSKGSAAIASEKKRCSRDSGNDVNSRDAARNPDTGASAPSVSNVSKSQVSSTNESGKVSVNGHCVVGPEMQNDHEKNGDCSVAASSTFAVNGLSNGMPVETNGAGRCEINKGSDKEVTALKTTASNVSRVTDGMEPKSAEKQNVTAEKTFTKPPVSVNKPAASVVPGNKMATSAGSERPSGGTDAGYRTSLQVNSDQEKTVKVKSTSAQKSTPSRPGMLLIRPASNLVAAKTNTEYLKLTQYNDVRKGDFAPAARKANTSGTAVVNVDAGDDVDGEMIGSDTEVDSEEKITFSGAGISLGRSMLTKTKQGQKLQINFDDTMTKTFEYPSEQSLMDATPAQPGYVDYEENTDEEIPDYNAMGSGLRGTPSITSGGSLSSYKARVQVDYQFGMHVNDERKETIPSKPAKKQASEAVKSTESDSATWSNGASSDLLF